MILFSYGEVAERLNAVVLKTSGRFAPSPGFESQSPRHENSRSRMNRIRKVGRAVEGAALERQCTLSRTEGSNPSPSAKNKGSMLASAC